MNLSVVCERWDTQRGGCEVYLAGLFEYAAAAGHRVRILCQRAVEPAHNAELKVLSPIQFPSFFRQWSFDRAVSLMLRTAPTVPVLAVHPHGLASHYQIHAGLYRSVFEAERESIDSSLRRWFYRSANQLNLRRQQLISLQERLIAGEDSPKIMVFSKRVFQALEQRYHVPAHRVTVLPLGVDTELFRPPTRSRSEMHQMWGGRVNQQGIRLLFVAHNFRLKGLHCVFEAMRNGKRLGLKAHLLVIGNGPIPAFRRLASKYGLTSHVQFAGRVGRIDLPLFYHASDLLIQPTFYDHCSLATLEALSCGCPVITTKRNGASELMVSGREGILVDHPRDTEALVEAIGMAQDPCRLTEMRQAASELRERLEMKIHMRSVLVWLGLSCC